MENTAVTSLSQVDTDKDGLDIERTLSLTRIVVVVGHMRRLASNDNACQIGVDGVGQ